jgi:hypothetical protein
MKWFVAAALACAMVTGAASVPRLAVAEETYAKVTVELKGWVRWDPPSQPGGAGDELPTMEIGGGTYRLDFWKGKGNKKAIDQKGKELRDKLVLVQGRLILPASGRFFRVEVTKLTVLPNQKGNK